MTVLRLRYIQRLKDRHGVVRHYFRRPGYHRATLPGVVGSAEFMEAYQRALQGNRSIGAERSLSGSVSALLVSYYASADFLALQPQTQRNYRHILEGFRGSYGDFPVSGMKREHVARLMDQRAGTPGAAATLLRRLRTLFNFAVERAWRSDNPTTGVKPPRYTSDGFIAWSDDDISAYEKHWPAGTRERLALYLLLFTGQRRSDVVRMGRQHISRNRLYVVQDKGQGRVKLLIPVHEALQEELNRLPANDMTFLMTVYGRPMTKAGFSKWFVDSAKAAGLIGRTPHGLRKAAARRLAEAGCTPHEIRAVTGHSSLKEVERYTLSVDQERLAEKAINALENKA